MKGKIGNDTISVLIDSGSVCSMVTKDIAELLINSSEEAKWLTKKRTNHRYTSNKSVTTLGIILSPIECNNWSAKNNQFVIVKYGLRPLIRRD